MHRIYNGNLGILLLLLITGTALYFASRVTVYHDLEAFFPTKDADLDFYNEHRGRFQSDDNFIYIGLENKEGVFDSIFLQQVQAFIQACDTIPFLTNISAITNIKDVVYSSFGAMPVDVLHENEPHKYQSDSIRIYGDERLVGRYISKSGKVLSVLLFHEEEMIESDVRIMNDALYRIINNFESKFDGVYVAGRSISVNAIVDTISSEFSFYTVAAVLLTLVIMGITLQRFYGVVLSTVSVILGLIVFMGLIGFTQKSLDIMSPLFPALLIVVGMSDVIHVLSKYLDEIGLGKDRLSALKITMREIGWATFLTSITTAIGFASLATANINAIKAFGLYAAAGVLLTYFVVMLFMASVLLRFKPSQLSNLQHHQQFWYKLMSKLHRFSYAKERFIIIGTVVLLLACLWGISEISTNVYMLGDVPKSNKLRSDFLFFEKELSGIRAFETAITTQGDYKINDLEVLQEIEKFTDFLKTLPAIGTVYAPNMVYKSMHKANNGGVQSAYILPTQPKLIEKYDRQMSKAAGIEQLRLLMSEDKRYGRVSGNMRDLGSKQVGHLNQYINKWVDKNIDANLIDLHLTGTALLVDKNHHYLRKSLFSGLGVAFCAVSILMGFLFKSWRMVVISLIPNIFPLLIAGAVMGYFGISLKASTSIIFTIAFGIAVDDTIHFLSKFKLALNKGYEVEEAIRITFIETGKAICLTTILLFFGFFIMITSDFSASYYIGLLVSLTLVSALVADFLLLPICLRWGFAKKQVISSPSNTSAPSLAETNV